MTNPNRDPKGTPTGGQFAAGTKPGPASAVTLADPPAEVSDKELAAIEADMGSRARAAAIAALQEEERLATSAQVAARIINAMPEIATVKCQPWNEDDGDGSDLSPFVTAVTGADGEDLSHLQPEVQLALADAGEATGWASIRDVDLRAEINAWRDSKKDPVQVAAEQAERTVAEVIRAQAPTAHTVELGTMEYDNGYFLDAGAVSAFDADGNDLYVDITNDTGRSEVDDEIADIADFYFGGMVGSTTTHRITITD